jgi:TolB-like protein/DNA-binding winged helix-turn-helix (wHTH) protein/Flp pilus assembly protein TadD
MSLEPGGFYRFGHFRLDVRERVLWRDEELIALTPKAVEVLIILVERRGQVVAKDDLMERLWPDTFVEETNLSHHIHKIREALGEQPDGSGFIETLPKRGYRFVAPVLAPVESQPTLPADEADSRGSVTLSERRRALPLATMVVGAALLVLIAGGYLLTMAGAIARPAPATVIRSIAVLPFEPLVQSDHDEALELGMANAVIARLTKVTDLTVRPTSSVVAYTGPARNPAIAGRELRVDAVVDGKIQRSGDRIRVTVQLVTAVGGQLIWADTFDQRAEDVFAIQDAIATQLVSALRITLTTAERQELTRHGTSNLAAYDAFLRGVYHNSTFDEGGFDRAQKYLTEAVTLDPYFAQAWGALAFAYSELAATDLSTAEAAAKAKAAVQRALEIDDTVLEAHLALVNMLMYYDWDLAGAERECRRLIELAPRIPVAHQFSAWHLGLMGRFDEAISAAEHARRLDPSSFNVVGAILAIHVWSHRPDALFAEVKRVMELLQSNDPGPARAWIAQAMLQQGRLAEAINEFEHAAMPDIIKQGYLGHAYARAGRRTDAQKVIAGLESAPSRGYVPAYQLAQIYTGLGDHARAIDWLEKAHATRSAWMVWLKVEPTFDALRSDARFIDLLRRIGFTS